MPKFERETATNATDLPHEFAGQAAWCEVCLTGVTDVRHLAWERQEIADRERAGHQMRRELGS